MPYGLRVFCALVGGVLLMAGTLLCLDEMFKKSYGTGTGVAALTAGLGLGLVMAAFVRRD